MQFESSIVFLLIPALASIVFYRYKRRHTKGIGSSDDTVIKHVSNAQMWIYKIPYLLQLTGAFLLIVALARPVTVNTKSELKSKGIAIQMVVDISSSMDQSVEIADSVSTRMEVAKHVIKNFIAGNDSTFKGRKHDVIGIISFARFANTVCPFVIGPDVLVHFVDKLEIESRPNEDGTAYGDATALASARLDKIDAIYGESHDKNSTEVKSKIIILLTDGENNCGRYQPLSAAALAKKWGVKVYTISLQDEPEVEEISHNEQTALVPSELSQTDLTLQQMSNMTKGKFWRAHDFNSLSNIYKEIDELEKSEIKTIAVIEKKDIFQFFALLALICFAIEIVIRNTWLRRIP